MGLELATKPDRVTVRLGFVLVGEEYPIAINPHAVESVEVHPLTIALSGVQLRVSLRDGRTVRLVVGSLDTFLRACERAIIWRETPCQP